MLVKPKSSPNYNGDNEINDHDDNYDHHDYKADSIKRKSHGTVNLEKTARVKPTWMAMANRRKRGLLLEGINVQNRKDSRLDEKETNEAQRLIKQN